MHIGRYQLTLVMLPMLFLATELKTFGQIDTMPPNHESSDYINWKKSLDLRKYWCSYNFPREAQAPFNYAAAMKIRIAPSGKVTHISVKVGSGNPEADFSCLESLVSAAPFPAMPSKRNDGSGTVSPERFQSTILFGGSESQPKQFPEAASFFAKYPEAKNRSYLLHLIPLGINEHYPALFSDSELRGINNIVAIKGDVDPDEAIQPFLDDWQAFISHNKKASKTQILNEASSIKMRHQRSLIAPKSYGK